MFVSSEEMLLMQTAKREIKGQRNSKGEIVRILLDSGSQRTYVTESLADKLQLKRDKEEKVQLVTFGCERPKYVVTAKIKLSIKLYNGQYLDITANIVLLVGQCNLMRRLLPKI